MEISGKVVKILDPVRFVSKKDGNEYYRHSFVIETGGQYPKHVAFTVLGDEKFKTMGVEVGGMYNVSFDIDAREWQGRWFNDISAWRVVRVDNLASNTVAQPVVMPTNATPVTPSNVVSAPQVQQTNDDLPF